MNIDNVTLAEQRIVLPRALAVLGIKVGATRKQVKSAYREKARRYHPDKGGNCVEFNNIKQAYEFLCKYGTKQKAIPPNPQSFGFLDGFGDPFAGISIRVVCRRATR